MVHIHFCLFFLPFLTKNELRMLLYYFKIVECWIYNIPHTRSGQFEANFSPLPIWFKKLQWNRIFIWKTLSLTVPSQSTSKLLKDGNHQTSYSSNSSLLSGPMSLLNDTENGAIRKSPEGKDNDVLQHEDNKLTRDTTNKYRENSGNHAKIGNDISTEIFSTSNDNGKINVQVTVLVGEVSFSFVCIFFLLFSIISDSFFHCSPFILFSRFFHHHPLCGIGSFSFPYFDYILTQNQLTNIIFVS